MKKFFKSKMGLLVSALLCLSTIAVAAGLIRWQPVQVNALGSVGNYQVATGSFLLRGIFLNTVTSATPNATVNVYDSASGQSYTAGVIQVLSLQAPSTVSLTAATAFYSLPEGVYFKNGIVVEVGSNTVNATYLLVPAN